MSDALTEKKHELEVALAEIETAKAALAAKEAAVKKIHEAMQKLVLNGASTGDRIRDHVIKNGGSYNSTKYDELSALDRLLKGKVGELIAVIYTKDEFVRTDQPRVSKQYMNLGILRGESLLFQKEKGDTKYSTALPVDCYANKHIGTWEIVRGPIVRWSWESLVAIDEAWLEKNAIARHTSYVLVGTEAVRTLVPSLYRYRCLDFDLWGHNADPEKIFKDVGLFELDGS